ncbi:hypothetical protein MADE_1014840 [Alteromonas mediterranea DE]|uniref:Uncharacterized protein n=1 Tax=Alteromonas mediterranea (strain DSM 17117 / CIP 110805 / LMG 28347 / Deep ecotype) TaxID=1774373 RepID=F2GCE6_ALTMD|nr:hypothetical protein MADE_1014840 [Alteromonas mediterranea DE]
MPRVIDLYVGFIVLIPLLAGLSLFNPLYWLWVLVAYMKYRKAVNLNAYLISQLRKQK